MSLFRVDPATGIVEFLYHVVGRGTRALAVLAPGDRLSIVGPLGTGFRLDPAWRRILVLARGVGLATLAPLADWAAANRVDVTAVLSARRADDLMAREFAGTSGARILPVFDDDGSSAVERVEALLRDLFIAARPDMVFTCGSNRLLLLLQRLAGDDAIPGQIALEQQMGCGLGMCFCCVRALKIDGQTVYHRVCTEGPVFDLAQALSW
jgi:dihydroorotate dehydrogenase electron transfer subunit